MSDYSELRIDALELTESQAFEWLEANAMHLTAMARYNPVDAVLRELNLDNGYLLNPSNQSSKCFKVTV